MTKMTSAYANKMLRKLNEDKEYWRSKELAGYVYVAALDEEPVIPEYDYKEVAKNIEEIDEKIILHFLPLTLEPLPVDVQDILLVEIILPN